MSSYLTEDELSLYTSTPITYMDACNATLLIDSYKGMSFFPVERSDRVKLTVRDGDYGEEYRGRLKHKPRAEIKSVTASVRFPFSVEQVDCGIDSIVFDDDDSPYFSFIPKYNPIFPTPVPKTIVVQYTSGYSEIPEELKRVTAQLAANLKLSGGGLKWTSREDFDLKITLTKDGVFTNEIKRMIDLIEVS